MDRGLTGSLLSLMRLKNNEFSPNEGAGKLDMSNQSELAHAIEILATRAGNVAEDNARKLLAENELKERADEWAKEASKGGRILGYEREDPKRQDCGVDQITGASSVGQLDCTYVNARS